VLESSDWDPKDASAAVMCDSCLEGLGFWSVDGKRSEGIETSPIVQHEGFYAEIPPNDPNSTIFFYEAVCVVMALIWHADRAKPPPRLAIYTDNLNTVQMFHSLKARSQYNSLLKFVVSILIYTKISLRVLHVPGAHNIVADAISRQLFDVATTAVASPQVEEFDYTGRSFPRFSRHRLIMHHSTIPPHLTTAGASQL
jgi:hypothetical protein